MSKTRTFTVLRPFPVWWLKQEIQTGETLEVERAGGVWPQVGGGYYRHGVARIEKPDISGHRIEWLLKHHYLEESFGSGVAHG